MIRKLFFAFAVTTLCAAGSASAQDPQKQPEPVNPRRQMLEERLRERTGEIVRRRLELTDDQMKKLQAANGQFEKQRGDLMMRERELRRELRQEIVAGDKANQNRVAQLLDQTMVLERQRLDLVQNEQRELAKFLTPVQRAKLFGLQNELRRRTQELRAGQLPRRQGPMRGPARLNR
jgi:Spy/CpxP family protein refolding chaperone